MSDSRKKEEKKVGSRVDFFKHLSSFGTVNLILFLINFAFREYGWWFYWVTVIWGVFIAVNFTKTFILSDKLNEGYKEGNIREEIEKIKNK